MKAEAIRDEASLRAWLEARPEAVRQREAIWIAFRAAARVFPFWAATIPRYERRTHRSGADRSLLPGFRCLLMAGISPNVQLNDLSIQTALDALSHALYDIDEAWVAAARSVVNALRVRQDWTVISGVMSEAIRATVFVLREERQRTRGFTNAFDQEALETQLREAEFCVALLWKNVARDVSQLAHSGEIPALPLCEQELDLFLLANGVAIRTLIDQRTLSDLDQRTLFDFWMRWWEGVLLGEPLAEDLQKRVALIEDAIWREGPEAIAAEIARIEADFAFEATENGEEVYADPASGRLGLRATLHLPEPLEARMRRSLGRLSRLFGDVPGNQHRALLPDLQMLEEVAQDEMASAVEIFDTFASASRRLRNRVANGECPSGDQDALIEDYSRRITDAAADLLGESPEVQAVLTRRNGLKGNSALQDGQHDILAAIEQIRPALLQSFAVKLEADLNLAASVGEDPEEKRDAAFRLSGRMLRIGAFAVAVVAAPVTVVTTTSDFLSALHSIAADPIYQAALHWIMRWLGL
jgi:hypothetical protein